jgi:hypothetical protein
MYQIQEQDDGNGKEPLCDRVQDAIVLATSFLTVVGPERIDLSTHLFASFPHSY